MHRIWVVVLVFLMVAGVGLGIGWIYGSLSNDPVGNNKYSRDLNQELRIVAQPLLEGDYGRLAMTSIENLLLKSSVISGNSANLTFSYLANGKPSTLSLNTKYGFAIENGVYYIGSGPFPFKVGDKVDILISHIENKGDTTNARMIQNIENNQIATPEQKRAIKVAIGSFGDTVLTREDLQTRLEQGGDVRLDDNEIRVKSLVNIQ